MPMRYTRPCIGVNQRTDATSTTIISKARQIDAGELGSV
jgi:hypothetical protein